MVAAKNINHYMRDSGEWFHFERKNTGFEGIKAGDLWFKAGGSHAFFGDLSEPCFGACSVP